MGNNLSLEAKENIFNKLVLEYENYKAQKLHKRVIFTKLLEKYNSLINNNLPTLDLFDIDLSGVDGIIKTETFTLVGWNDNNEDIDIDELESIVKKNDRDE